MWMREAGVAMTPLMPGLVALMALWAVIGFGFSLTQTPIGRILNRSARPEDRPAVFAAQFALSHACWLVTYPLAGWIGAGVGLSVAAFVLAAIGAAGLVAVSALLLAACSTPARTAPSATPSPDKLTGTVTVLAAASLTEVYGTLASEFEKLHPNVTVTQSYGGSSALQ